MAAPVAILAKPDDHRGILTMRQGSMRLLRRFAIGRRTRWWQRCGGAAIGRPIYDKLSRRRKQLVIDFKPRESTTRRGRRIRFD
jgi:hypothetical protein